MVRIAIFLNYFCGKYLTQYRVIFHYTCLGGPPIEMTVPTQGSLGDSFVLASPLLRLLITFLVPLDRIQIKSLIPSLECRLMEALVLYCQVFISSLGVLAFFTSL